MLLFLNPKICSPFKEILFLIGLFKIPLIVFKFELLKLRFIIVLLIFRHGDSNLVLVFSFSISESSSSFVKYEDFRFFVFLLLLHILFVLEHSCKFNFRCFFLIKYFLFALRQIFHNFLIFIIFSSLNSPNSSITFLISIEELCRFFGDFLLFIFISVGNTLETLSSISFVLIFKSSFIFFASNFLSPILIFL